jgi:predicted DNA-binding transcriptional regulator YafY
MCKTERQAEIMEILRMRHTVTMRELAEELGVCIRTIKYDIDALSSVHPIVTICGRYGGGVTFAAGMKHEHTKLDSKQEAVLREVIAESSGEKRNVLESILSDFR